jgi:hypothetical protein
MLANVILSEAKNRMDLGTYMFEILRLTPQNDVVGPGVCSHSKAKTIFKSSIIND